MKPYGLRSPAKHTVYCGPHDSADCHCDTKFINKKTERQRAKEESRRQDAEDLATGRKTREQLREENGHFSRLNIRPDYAGAKRLS